ncbi:MAG: peptidylprolyl isomerase [Alphaproteobacteria bacterium]|nr:peptidylprolyl isomerase [Alphaproteobacteria bacterium]
MGVFMMTTLGGCDARSENPMLEMVVASADGTVLGTMEIKLFPEKAPKHVERILKLAKEGFYNGLKFHRVIAGFMVQTGCPYGTGTGGSKYPDLPAEFNDVSHKRGILSMARAQDPNSANSQFFIMLADTPYLDGQYTVFGEVVKGLETVDTIQKGDARMNGSVANPSIIKELKIK